MSKIRFIINVTKAAWSVNGNEDATAFISRIIEAVLVYQGRNNANKAHYDWFVRDRKAKEEASKVPGKKSPALVFIQQDYSEVIRFLTYARNLVISDKTADFAINKKIKESQR